MKTLTLLKQTVSLGFVGSTILFSSLASQALTVEEVTNPRLDNGGWVTDMADILSDETETNLNQMITDLEQANGTEIAVVTVPETAPADSPKAFTTQLFNYWGIGKAESDNGVLFLVSTGDRRVEIETGYGIESILPDSQVGNIIDTKITPQYKQGDYDRGTLDGTEALISTLNPNANIDNSSELSSMKIDHTQTDLPIVQTSSIVFILFFCFLIFVVTPIILNNYEDDDGNSGNGGKGKKKKRSTYDGGYYGDSSGSDGGGGGYSGGGEGGGYSGGGEGGGYSGGGEGGGFGGGSSGGGGEGGGF